MTAPDLDEDWPDDAEWCDRCQGMGIANCYCGGDQCYCENYGEMECPQCDGEGMWVPTEAQKKARAELADFMRELWAASGMEAGTAETTGSVHDSAVGNADAPNGDGQ